MHGPTNLLVLVAVLVAVTLAVAANRACESCALEHEPSCTVCKAVGTVIDRGLKTTNITN